jgi:hypothetical protein
MKNIKTFIGESILKYSKVGMSFIFKPQQYLKEGRITYTGEASDTGIVIATGGDFMTWVQVFVHETCHLDQYLERPRWFNNSDTYLNDFNIWLTGQPVKNIRKTVVKIIELERDCEERAIEKIKKNKLEINLKTYTQQSNAYLLGYTASKKNRKWTDKPYENKEMYMKLPSKLMPLRELKDPDWEKLGLSEIIIK